MKRNTKFYLIIIISIIVLSCLGATAAVFAQSLTEKSDRDALTDMIIILKSKYPDLSDTEIIAILDGKADTSQKQEIRRFLYQYGIDDKASLVLENDQNHIKAAVIGFGVSMLGGLVFLTIFFIYSQKQKRTERKLTNYLNKLNTGKYKLVLKDISENENSVLESEIYKTTVMLRENSERTMDDKLKLKDSLSDISHQLKTPLTSISIMVDNLIDNEDMPPELRQEFLHDIKRSVSHLNFLTLSLLTLSKLDADSIEFRNEEADIDDIFRECKENTEIIAEIKGVNVIAEPADMKLNCDKRWICEAITNILKNCIEYTDEDGSVTLKAESTNFYKKITVSDTGCGMDKKEAKHIFERFYKGKNSDENSVGIGLAMAKTIIEKSGGDIKVFSEPNKGTRFVIKFLK